MHKSCAFFFIPCTIDADPLIVDFGSHHPRDVSDNPIKPNRPTMATISCEDKVKRSVYLRVFPAIPPRKPNNYATLVHTDSNQPFKGLGLIYKYGEELRSCDQGQAWGESFLFGNGFTPLTQDNNYDVINKQTANYRQTEPAS